MINNGEASQTITVKNGTYTLSFIYKKLISLATCKIKVNDTEIELTSTNYESEEYKFEVSNNSITIRIIGDTDSSCLLLNLMLNSGDVKLPYSYNNNETISDTVQIGKGIQIKATGSDTIFDAEADGIRIYSTKSNEVVTEFTSKGINTDYINTKEGIIAKVMYKDVGDQTFITRIGD